MIQFGNWRHGQRIFNAFVPELHVCISRTAADGTLLGGVVFEEFTGRSVQLHLASFAPRWMNRDLLWVVFDYPFNQLKVEQVLGYITEDNAPALNFARRIGLREISRIPDVVPAGDVVVMSIRRENCPWLDLKPRGLSNGQPEV